MDDKYVVVCSVFLGHYLQPILYPSEQILFPFYREERIPKHRYKEWRKNVTSLIGLYRFYDMFEFRINTKGDLLLMDAANSFVIVRDSTNTSVLFVHP